MLKRCNAKAQARRTWRLEGDVDAQAQCGGSSTADVEALARRTWRLDDDVDAADVKARGPPCVGSSTADVQAQERLM